MLGKIFGILTVSSFVFAVACGKMQELSAAAVGGCAEAVKLSISLLGAMCLWSGVASVLDAAGFTKVLEKIVSPVLKIIYPESYKRNCGISECASNISANFFGLGNAALPLGIECVKKFSQNSLSVNDKANDDSVMFAVLATTPFQLLPTTLATMREAAGSASPYEILLPVWICEILTTVFAVIACKLLAKVFR